MNWDYLTLNALAVEESDTVLVCTDESGAPVVVKVLDQDLTLLLPYSRIFEASQKDLFGVALPVIPVEGTLDGLIFSREGALYDLRQLTQPDLVDTERQRV